MKKQFSIEGMSCGHCRKSVEQALNSLEGIRAEVTLDPPLAVVEFSGTEYSLEELNSALAEAGEYRIFEM